MLYFSSRKEKEAMKNKILWSITYAAIAVFLASVLLADSESCIPMLTGGLSTAWLSLFFYVNRDKLGYDQRTGT